MTLALTGAGPTFSSPVIVWMRPLSISPYGPNISVGTTGVYVAGDDQLSKYDFDGNVLWTRQIGASPEDFVTEVSVAPLGVYVVGANGGSAFVGLYDFDGSMIWTRYFETGSVLTASLSADSRAVYVAGTVLVRFDGHSFIAKFDSKGNELWNLRIDSRGVTAISVGPKAVYLAEYSRCFWHCHFISNTFVTAIDFDGNTLWTRQLNSQLPPTEGGGYSTLAVGPTGIYVAETTLQGVPETGYIYTVSFVRKYDFAGNELWTRQSISGIRISADSRGVYITGNLWIAPVQRPAQSLVQHLDSDGNEVWTFQFDPTVSPGPISVSIRGVFVAGASTIARLCASPSCLHN